MAERILAAVFCTMWGAAFAMIGVAVFGPGQFWSA